MRRFGILAPQGQKPYGFRLMLTAYGERLLREVKNMNETEETKENTETQPEGNLGAVNRAGR